MEILVTTSHRTTLELIQKAQAISQRLGTSYIPRADQNLEQIMAQGTELVLVVAKNGLTLAGPEGEHFFHPNMAKVRIKSLINGNNDQMVNAMTLSPGDSVLDCTLGLGADALVAGYQVGPLGKVTGLEKVPVLALILEDGLVNYPVKAEYIKEAMNRITVINIGYEDYLPQCPDQSFDVVYFDPMFRVPQEKTSAFVPMRQLVDATPLNQKAIQEGIRVARKRVVLKERRQSKEFARLGFEQVMGGKYSSLAYGIIETGVRG